MSHEQPKNPLHGVTLKAIVEALVERHGWEALAERAGARDDAVQLVGLLTDSAHSIMWSRIHYMVHIRNPSQLSACPARRSPLPQRFLHSRGAGSALKYAQHKHAWPLDPKMP